MNSLNGKTGCEKVDCPREGFLRFGYRCALLLLAVVSGAYVAVFASCLQTMLKAFATSSVGSSAFSCLWLLPMFLGAVSVVGLLVLTKRATLQLAIRTALIAEAWSIFLLVLLFFFVELCGSRPTVFDMATHVIPALGYPLLFGAASFFVNKFGVEKPHSAAVIVWLVLVAVSASLVIHAQPYLGDLRFLLVA